MAKMALVVGVSDYEPGLTSLPGATRDVEAIRRVLQNPEVGGFDDVKTLSNPDPLTMQEAIETLFSGRTKDDLVLLFFSGHGVKDDQGKLHLATRITRKTLQGELIRATSVPASFVQDIMGNSRSKRQVVILDCCFSGAFAEGWSAKDDGSVDVKTQLGGEGRAVLTSSTSTQYSFEQEGSDLSTYTRYLVEGIETGAADLDSDGMVSIDELHDYAKGKVQEAAPAMKPEIYAIKEGYKIRLAQAPTEDPKLRYRKEVEHFASHGVISVVGRNTLDALRDEWGVLLEEAKAIEDEVLKPHQEYQKRMQRYEQVLAEATQREHSLSSDTQNELKRLQQVLKLRDEDIAQVKAQESIPMKTGLSKVPPISVSVLKNPKLLIGSGIATAVALTLMFVVRTPQPVRNVEPAPAVSSTVYSEPQISAQGFFKRGGDKSYKDDFKGAIEDYNQAIQLKPKYPDAYYYRGTAKAWLDDYKGAIADYNQAIQLKPEYPDAYVGRGSAKSWLDDFKGAIADYRKAAELYQKQGKTKDYQDALKQIKELQ
jgi:tetratricopeptide (TPR) repeat protein